MILTRSTVNLVILGNIGAIHRVLAVLLCLLPTISANAQPTAPDPSAVFLPGWNHLPDRAGWQMLVSPPFPGTWPMPGGRGTLVRYSCAMRLDPAVSDGAEVAAPWAKSTLNSTGENVVEQLSTRLRPLGSQGVRPLRSEEIALLGREQEVAQRLLGGGKPATDGVVRDFTCSWISRQGVVAAAIMPLHPAFEHWLACP
jgi:hypothetical protein